MKVLETVAVFSDTDLMMSSHRPRDTQSAREKAHGEVGTMMAGTLSKPDPVLLMVSKALSTLNAAGICSHVTLPGPCLSCSTCRSCFPLYAPFRTSGQSQQRPEGGTCRLSA